MLIEIAGDKIRLKPLLFIECGKYIICVNSAVCILLGPSPFWVARIRKVIGVRLMIIGYT